MLKVRGLSIESRSSTICIDLSKHVHVVKDQSVINLYNHSIIIMYIQCRRLEMRLNNYSYNYKFPKLTFKKL